MTSTPHPLRVGVVVVQNLAWPEWRRRVQEVEALGFDAVHVWDHLVHRTQGLGDPLFDGMTALAAAAEFTSTIRLGTMVAAPIHRHPVVLANQAMTIDNASGGRLELGIGAGGARLDHDVLGVPYWEPPELARRFRETVEIVDGVLRGASSYEGRYYRTEHAAVAPGPVQTPRPPLTLAAHGPTTLGIAGRHADIWNSSTPRDRSRDDALDALAERCRMLDEAAERAGRDPAAIRRSVMVGSDDWPALESVAAFRDAAHRYHAIGITDLVLIAPDHPAEAALGHGQADPDIVRRLGDGPLDELRRELG